MVSTVGSISIDLSTNAAKFAAGFRNAATTVARESGRMVSSVKGLERSFINLQSAAGAVGGSLALNSIKNYADAWTMAGSQIRASGQIADVQVRSLEKLNDMANRSRSGLEQTVELYNRLIRSSSGVAKSEEEVAQVTETVAKAFKAYGSAASEQAAGILQLGQALGSGFLQGDELRSIRENAPLLAQAIAEEFGTTIGGLKQLGAEGEITSARVFKALIRARKEVEKAFAETRPTIEDSFTQLKNNLTQSIGKLDAATGASRRFVAGINELADAIEKYGDDPSFDNLLKITGDDDPNSLVQKIRAGVNRVADDYKRWTDEGARLNEELYETQVQMKRVGDQVKEVDAEIAELKEEASGPVVDIGIIDAERKLLGLHELLDELAFKASEIKLKIDDRQARAVLLKYNEAIADLAKQFRAAEIASMDAMGKMHPLPTVHYGTTGGPTGGTRKFDTAGGGEVGVTSFSHTDAQGIENAVDKNTEATNRVAARATDVYRGVQQFDSHSAGYFDELGSSLGSAIRGALSYNVPSGGGYATSGANSFKYSGNNSSGSWAGRQMTFSGGTPNPLTSGNKLDYRPLAMGGNTVEDASTITSGATTSGAINVNIVVKPVMEGSRLSGQSTAEIKQAASAGANAALRAFYGR